MPEIPPTKGLREEGLDPGWPGPQTKTLPQKVNQSINKRQEQNNQLLRFVRRLEG
jgi:hypothetical protein